MFNKACCCRTRKRLPQTLTSKIIRWTTSTPFTHTESGKIWPISEPPPYSDYAHGKQVPMFKCLPLATLRFFDSIDWAICPAENSSLSSIMQQCAGKLPEPLFPLQANDVQISIQHVLGTVKRASVAHCISMEAKHELKQVPLQPGNGLLQYSCKWVNNRLRGRVTTHCTIELHN